MKNKEQIPVCKAHGQINVIKLNFHRKIDNEQSNKGFISQERQIVSEERKIASLRTKEMSIKNEMYFTGHTVKL